MGTLLLNTDNLWAHIIKLLEVDKARRFPVALDPTASFSTAVPGEQAVAEFNRLLAAQDPEAMQWEEYYNLHYRTPIFFYVYAWLPAKISDALSELVNEAMTAWDKATRLNSKGPKEALLSGVRAQTDENAAWRIDDFAAGVPRRRKLKVTFQQYENCLRQRLETGQPWGRKHLADELKCSPATISALANLVGPGGVQAHADLLMKERQQQDQALDMISASDALN
jgi:hypothetical protein